MKRIHAVLAAALAAIAFAAPSSAQTAAGNDTTPARARVLSRASWLSDRTPLRTGDILTVVLDEQTSARERVSSVATGRRSQRARLNATLNDEEALGNTDIASAMDNDSRDIGEANREGDLAGVLSVRVTSVEANGVATIEGAKTVEVDGRRQEITLKGSIRPEDVTSDNVVHSSRIAGAAITYKGKKIAPRMGIIGKILAILWP